MNTTTIVRGVENLIGRNGSVDQSRKLENSFLEQQCKDHCRQKTYQDRDFISGCCICFIDPASNSLDQ
uniref:Uncharacterized protein n=1 Tax=Romanomermis culicivorax TaxID=13658 RepID=A0A915IZI1_ROMCU